MVRAQLTTSDPRLHGDAADHEQDEIAAADARFHEVAGARGAAPRGGDGHDVSGPGREPTDALFRRAVALIDAGDVVAIERLLGDHSELARVRLDAAGPWLRDVLKGALDGFFKDPYLLWFVAEDPVRNGTLPKNIADVARAIVHAITREGVDSRQEQLDYALNLVAWSWIARDSQVQIPLIDVLVEAGAKLDGNPENALVNSNFEAAEYFVTRGARLTLATALCLGRWDDAARLAPSAPPRERQFAFTLCALKGKA